MNCSSAESKTHSSALNKTSDLMVICLIQQNQELNKKINKSESKSAHQLLK